MSDFPDAFSFFQWAPVGWQDQPPEQVCRVARRALGILDAVGGLPGARIIEGSDGALSLQGPIAIDAIGRPIDAGDWDALVQRAHDPIDPGDHASGDLDEGASDDIDSVERDTSTAIAVLEGIEALWLKSPALAPMLDFDDESPALLMAPEDADWAFAVVPAPWAGAVWALLSLTTLPDDPAHQAMMLRRALRANDMRLLGIDCAVVIDVEADLLLLQAVVSAEHTSADSWEALFGRMLALREILLEHWDQEDDSGAASATAAAHALALHLSAVRG